MKLMFTFLSIISTFFTLAQKKGDNTIVVSSYIPFSNLKSILFDNGYMVEGIDTIYIQTSPKQMKTLSVLKMQIKRTDTTIIIRGLAKVGIDLNFSGVIIKEDFEPVYYAKSKMNMHNEWFLEMNKVAKSISPIINYSKK